MSLPWILLQVWGFSALAMVATWAICRRVGNAGYVDVVWAALMAGAALYAGAVGTGAPLPRGLVAMFGGLWGARLSLHLLSRVLHEPEDGRYRFLREHWQNNQRRFFLFFQVQALFVVLFTVPFAAAASNQADDFGPWALAAVMIWLLSSTGEAIADRQLARHRCDPTQRGRSCRRGLWAWSRHPNYFFEWLHWFAYVLLAVGSPLFYWSLLGPLAMGLFLYRVTGIPYAEAQALRSRGDDYRAYQREVSAFFPCPPKFRKREAP